MSTGVKEYTLSDNKAYVEQASSDMAPAQLDDIERRAKARATDVREETTKLETQSENASSSEARVYGDMIVEAVTPGAKILSAVGEIILDRTLDKTENSDIDDKKPPRTIDDFVDDAKRPAGFYRAPAEAKAYDGVAANSPRVPLRVPLRVVEDKTDIADRAGIAAKSLNEQGKEALSTWDVPNEKMASVKFAKEMAYQTRFANEQALESVQAVRAQHDSMRYKINQIAPGLGLASGPSIRPQELLSEVSSQADSAA